MTDAECLLAVGCGLFVGFMLPEWIDESDGMHDPDCVFCDGHWNHSGSRVDHKPDCPWKLANES